MTQLRHARDQAREDAIESKATTAEANKAIVAMAAHVVALRDAGGAAAIRSCIASLRAAAYFKVAQDEQHKAASQTATGLAARADASVRIMKNALTREKERVDVLIGVQSTLREALTSFKRDELLSYRVRATALAAELAQTTVTRAHAAKAHATLGGQLHELEAGIRAIEKDASDMSSVSIIGSDGVVNAQIQRRKRRLERDLDGALTRLAERRLVFAAHERELDVAEETRRSQEEALKDVEGALAATLVAQQRTLVGILANVHLPQPLEYAETDVWSSCDGIGGPDGDCDDATNQRSDSSSISAIGRGDRADPGDVYQ